MKVKVVTLCSGYDSQLLALKRLKQKFPQFEYECIGWSDIDPNAIKAHNALFPELADKNLGDMTCIDWSKVEPFDLLTYSTPCQDVSLAGKRAGFEEGSETRSSIIWHTIDAIKVHHPKYLLGENVKGMVTGGNIGLYNKWKLLLESEGYSNFSRVLNAKDYGVPQNRERIFTISILGHDERFYFPKPFKLETRLKDVLDDVVDPQFFLKGDRVKDVIKTISD